MADRGERGARAVVVALVANVMFDLPAVEWSTTARSGGNLWFAEAIATLGLLVVIFGVVRSGRSTVAAFAVAGPRRGAHAAGGVPESDHAC